MVEKLEVGLFPCHDFFVVRFFCGEKFHGRFFRDIGFFAANIFAVKNITWRLKI